MVTVIVADDNASFLRAAADVVDATPGFQLVGTCGSGKEAVALAAELRPDLALVDRLMPRVEGPAVAVDIAAVSPETMTVVVSADPRPTTTPVIDKRSLSPELLRDLWRSRSAGDPERWAPSER
jgi:DNA-binding NarL/FixJ family response regulator